MVNLHQTTSIQLFINFFPWVLKIPYISPESNLFSGVFQGFPWVFQKVVYFSGFPGSVETQKKYMYLTIDFKYLQSQQPTIFLKTSSSYHSLSWNHSKTDIHKKPRIVDMRELPLCEFVARKILLKNELPHRKTLCRFW